MSDRLERPIFCIGMPRSGTTIVFEALARHPDLGWPSNYCRTHPETPAWNLLRRLLDNRLLRLYGHKKQYGKAPFYNLWLPQPDEAYEFWDAWTGLDFARSTLSSATCAPKRAERLRAGVAGVLGWQGRKRFAAKLTGPPRIGFLNQAFADPFFVHVVRDGRAVTHSLLNVEFWKEKGGFTGPFWKDLLAPEDIEQWRAGGGDPGILAALQWRRVIELTRQEAALLPPGHFHEIRYEDFTRDPHAAMSGVLDACGLSDAPAVHNWLEQGPGLRNMNGKCAQDFEQDYFTRLSGAMQPQLGDTGYGEQVASG